MSARWRFFWRLLPPFDPTRGEWIGEAYPDLLSESECHPSQLSVGPLCPALLLAPCHTSLFGLHDRDETEIIGVNASDGGASKCLAAESGIN